MKNNNYEKKTISKDKTRNILLIPYLWIIMAQCGITSLPLSHKIHQCF